ncbi:uncharacterized protein, partial [Primulina huaijiensis]|uniref:uncharacterized protein n=1 Tax=Primulina huaijiensis TaxID=1492673 RepID=UPI003CC78088
TLTTNRILFSQFPPLFHEQFKNVYAQSPVFHRIVDDLRADPSRGWRNTLFRRAPFLSGEVFLRRSQVERPADGHIPKGYLRFFSGSRFRPFRATFATSVTLRRQIRDACRYTFNISGVVNYGKIANLLGVAAQELFLWLPVKGIQVDVPSSGLIYFDVGVVFKQFSLSFFEEPKDCNAVEEEDGRGNEVFFFYDHGRIAEHESGNLWRKLFADEKRMADS